MNKEMTTQLREINYIYQVAVSVHRQLVDCPPVPSCHFRSNASLLTGSKLDRSRQYLQKIVINRLQQKQKNKMR